MIVSKCDVKTLLFLYKNLNIFWLLFSKEKEKKVTVRRDIEEKCRFSWLRSEKYWVKSTNEILRINVESFFFPAFSMKFPKLT